jgi:DNA-binding MarR family transcriptional regulator
MIEATMSDELDRAAILLRLQETMRSASALGVLFSDSVARKLGIAGSDLECLDLLSMRGPLTAGELARATGLTSGAITALLDRLERAGFATRQPDPHDRRKVRVAIVPDGLLRIAPFYQGMQRSMEALVARYTDEQLAVILDFFTRSEQLMNEQISQLKE